MAVVVENNGEIAVHPEASHYTIRRRTLRFFRINPMPTRNMKEIPRGANTLRFADYHEHKYNTYYGTPEFCSHRGNVLKPQNL